MFKYKILAQGFNYIKHTKIVDLILEKRFLFWIKPIPQTHKVYFDLYDKSTGGKIHLGGSANIEKHWQDLGFKKRKQVALLINSHFMSEYDVGNYRSVFEKKKKKTGNNK